MQIAARHLQPNELDHELIWLCVSVLSVAAAAGWLALGFPWPSCFFHDLTGLPCISCGMTRCAIQFFHAHFGTAFQWNPLVFISLCLLSTFNVYALAVLILRAPRLRSRFDAQLEQRVTRFLVLAALILNWVYLLSHWRRF